MPSIYETINQRAIAVKQARWQTYTPLTKQQLTDYDMVADEPPTPDPDPLPDWITVLTISVDPNPPVSSTQRSHCKYKQFIVLKRPTEMLCVAHSQGVYVLDDDYPPVLTRRPRAKRWCIYCRDRHNLSAFLHTPHYLHGLSYACKQSKAKHREQRWYYASLKEKALFDNKIILRDTVTIGG